MDGDFLAAMGNIQDMMLWVDLADNHGIFVSGTADVQWSTIRLLTTDESTGGGVTVTRRNPNHLGVVGVGQNLVGVVGILRATPWNITHVMGSDDLTGNSVAFVRGTADVDWLTVHVMTTDNWGVRDRARRAVLPNTRRGIVDLCYDVETVARLVM